MANTFYGLFFDAIGSEPIDLLANNIKAYLVSNTYTPNFSTDDFLDDIPGGAILSTSSNLSGKTLTLGVFDADDVTFVAVTGGSTGTYVVLAKSTGVSATSRLICAFDTGVNFPILTNGGDIVVQWPSSAGKIFTL